MARSTAALCLVLLLAPACWKGNPLFHAVTAGEDTTGDLTGGSSDSTSTTDPTSAGPTSGPTSSGPTSDPTSDTTSGSTGDPANPCGNGIQEPGEQCDNGDDNGLGQACEDNCKPLLLLGNDPTFTPTNGQWLAVADFSGDGLDDIAIADGTKTVSIWLNDGDGKAFTLGGGIPVNEAPTRLLAHDFSGDGKAELIAGTADGLTVFKQGGGNPLGQLVGDPQSAILGDQNSDGHVDLLIASPATKAVNSALATGTGLMPPLSRMLDGVTPSRLAVAEVTGDGKNDVLVSFEEGAVNPGFLLIASDDNSITPYTSQQLKSAAEVVVGRLVPDAPTGIGVYDPTFETMRVFADTGDGIMDKTTITVAVNLVRPLRLGFHGPDYDDLLFIDPVGGRLHIYPLPGGVIVQNIDSIDMKGTIFDYAPGDFNNDDKPDLAVLTLNGCYVLLNQFNP